MPTERTSPPVKQTTDTVHVYAGAILKLIISTFICPGHICRLNMKKKQNE